MMPRTLPIASGPPASNTHHLARVSAAQRISSRDRTDERGNVVLCWQLNSVPTGAGLPSDRRGDVYVDPGCFSGGNARSCRMAAAAAIAAAHANQPAIGRGALCLSRFLLFCLYAAGRRLRRTHSDRRCPTHNVQHCLLGGRTIFALAMGRLGSGAVRLWLSGVAWCSCSS